MLAAVLLAACAGWVGCRTPESTYRVQSVLGQYGPAPARSVPQLVRAAAARLWFVLRRERLLVRARASVVELCAGLGAELHSGRPPVEALRLAVAALPSPARTMLGGVAVTAERGGDVPAALRRVGERSGYSGLAWLAACWQVGLESGAGLAAAVERLADTLRAEQSGRREIAAQLAAPRATARLLAFLPVLGVVLAAGLGQAPTAFLLGSPYGVACLVAGVGMDAAGVWWTGRLARAAEPR